MALSIIGKSLSGNGLEKFRDNQEACRRDRAAKNSEKGPLVDRVSV